MTDKISNENKIEMYFHCGQCVTEWKADKKISSKQSPKDYSQIQAGWTKKGLQIWCNRHNCNILHIDFEGKKHPANVSIKEVKK